MRRASLTLSILYGKDHTTNLLVAVDLLLGTRQRRQRPGERARKRHRKVLCDNILVGITKLSTAWPVVVVWKRDLWAHLQGDPRGPESVSGERDLGQSSPTPSMPSGRLAPPGMWSTLKRQGRILYVRFRG